MINVALAVFNLLPLPPLDGGRVVTGLLPLAAARRFARIERYGFLILLLLLYTDTVDRLINPVIRAIARSAAMSDEGAALKFEGDGGMRFRLPIYEGPLDLLLHLIKRAELDPHDVTASIITEQYLEHLNLMEELNLDIAGEYLVMAATLLLIKSFALLPHPALADTEEAEELKHDLVERLLEYQRYREAAAKLGERRAARSRCFRRRRVKRCPRSRSHRRLSGIDFRPRDRDGRGAQAPRRSHAATNRVARYSRRSMHSAHSRRPRRR